MDKVTVNNQVVQMRKFVKQAKIHVINKCVKQIKMLQCKKGAESQLLKYKRKVERLLAEVVILKKMKPDHVSKLALSKAKDWKSLLDQKNISLEDRCLAMLANYDAVQREVEKFHTSHDDLVQKIPALLLEWEEKSKNEHVEKKVKASDIRKKINAKITKRKNMASFPNNIKVAKKGDQDVHVSRPIPTKDISNSEAESPVAEQDVAHSSDIEPAEMEHGDIDDDEEDRMESDKESSKPIESDMGSADEQTKPLDSDMESDNESSKSVGSNDIFENDEYGHSMDKSIINPQRFFKRGNSNKLETPKYQSKKFKNDESISSDYKNVQIDVEETGTNEEPKSCKPKSNLTPGNRGAIFAKLKESSQQSKKDTLNTKSKKAIAVLDLSKLESMDEIPIENTSDTEESTNEAVVRKKDSFFLSGAGGSESEESEEDEDKVVLEPRKVFSKKESSSSFRKKEYNNKPSYKGASSFQKKEFPSYRGDSSSLGKQNNKDFHVNKGKSFKFNESKPKFETNRFKNKRDFNKMDNSSEYRNQNKKSSPSNSFSQKKPNFQDKKDQEVGPLHPSWEAKRKLKESVKAKFEGKRIVFDE